MLIGYARVSTDDQSLDDQRRTLEQAGAERLFEDKASGAVYNRPELDRAIDQLRDGDVFIVIRLDRVSRSLLDTLRIIRRIEASGAGFRSLTEQIDTTSAAGRMMMQMIGAFAEYERQIIRERVKSGVENARKNGRHPGKRPALNDQQRRIAVDLVLDKGETISNVARTFKVSHSTVSRVVTQAKIERGDDEKMTSNRQAPQDGG